MSLFSQFEAWVEMKAWPFIKNLGKEVVVAETKALLPIATKAVVDGQQAVLAATASGSLSGLGEALGAIIKDAASKAERAGISAGASSLLGAVGSGLATYSGVNTQLALQAKPSPAPSPAGSKPASR